MTPTNEIKAASAHKVVLQRAVTTAMWPILQPLRVHTAKHLQLNQPMTTISAANHCKHSEQLITDTTATPAISASTAIISLTTCN